MIIKATDFKLLKKDIDIDNIKDKNFYILKIRTIVDQRNSSPLKKEAEVILEILKKEIPQYFI